ncbi:MAG TPA: electron transfer flavoprotein subunit beta/FixA family protein [Syntrophomonas sp.]|nr:electron transfer flavoprotein subunit beta/FixA family protein [Syntrophomonas sp.]
MPRIVTCYKWVLDEADIKINADLSVDTARAKRKIGDYDRNTIEAAVRVARETKRQVVGLTFGTEKCKQSLKEALARGLDEAYWISYEGADGADAKFTAKVLAAAINKIEDVDLVLCTDGSSDVFARQTASRIAAVLDWPIITAVCKLVIDGDTATVLRRTDSFMEVFKVQLPTVISVLPEINPAPLPGLSAIIGAAKKPSTELKADELDVSAETNISTNGIIGYAMNRKNILFSKGQTADRVKELVMALRKEGVL